LNNSSLLQFRLEHGAGVYAYSQLQIHSHAYTLEPIMVTIRSK